MNLNKPFKLLALLLCLIMAIGLVACKDGNTDDSTSTKTETSQGADDKTPPKDNTSSGIELEEDVFDGNDVQSGTSSGNSSVEEDDNTVSKNDKTETDTNVSGGDNTDDNITGDDESSVDTPITPEQDNDIVVDSDGVVHLPIDKF